MIRILVIAERFWPEGGGGTLATYHILKLLSSVKEINVSVLTSTPNPVKIGDVSYLFNYNLKSENKLSLWLKLLLNPSIRISFKKVVQNFDVVYFHSLGYPLIPLAKKLKKRVVIHLHDYLPISYSSVIFSGKENHLSIINSNAIEYEILENQNVARAIFTGLTSPIIELCKLWVREADLIICPSNRFKKLLISKVPEIAHKLKVIYNPLPEIPSIEKKLKKPKFLFIGGDSYVKGFYVFLNASRILLKKHNDIDFIVAGDMKEKSRVMMSALNTKYYKSYLIYGKISHKNIFKLHSESYALLFPSLCEEPLPYAVIESMLAETVPIASRVGGVPEIVKGTYAEKMLFKPGDVDELTDKIDAVLSLSKDQLIDVGIGLRESILKRFDNSIIKNQLLKIFSDN